MSRTSSQLGIISKRMFGPGSLRITNIGITRGSNSHSTPEQIAGEINKAITQIEKGDFEIIEDLDKN